MALYELIAGKAVDAAQRGVTYLFGKRKADKERQRLAAEEAQERQIVNDLRRASNGRCLRPAIDSEEDRLLGRMAEKGLLVRTPLGYMLPEFSGAFGQSSRFRSRFY